MNNRRVLLSLVAGAVAAALPATALAVSDNISGTANVLTPMTVTGSRTLDFGDVFPGLTKAIAITDATSGKWTIDGEPGKEVTLSFSSLPATLVNGGNTLAIAYSTTDGGHHTTDAPGSATTFDPAAGATTTLEATTGDLFVWVGGTASPTPTQVAGTYTGTLTLDVLYTGN